MTGKPVTFYEANLCDRESLRVPFRKVIDNFDYVLLRYQLKDLNIYSAISDFLHYIVSVVILA